MFVNGTSCLYIVLIGAHQHLLNSDKHMKQMCSKKSYKNIGSYNDKKSTVYFVQDSL